MKKLTYCLILITFIINIIILVVILTGRYTSPMCLDDNDSKYIIQLKPTPSIEQLKK